MTTNTNISSNLVSIDVSIWMTFNIASFQLGNPVEVRIASGGSDARFLGRLQGFDPFVDAQDL